jgi:hypothetical protein
MIPRKLPNGELMLIPQTDHSRLAGQLAAHWGNDRFATPQPFASVARAATFHDFGHLTYETNPQINPENGETYIFRDIPFEPRTLDSYQWCVDWLAGVDPYSALLVSMHRTGLWQARYNTISSPAGRMNPKGQRPEIQAFIERNEAWQAQQRTLLEENGVATNYHLLQVWDLLALYFCCQEPCDDAIEPVPTAYGEEMGGVRLTMGPVGDHQVRFDPYPFDLHPLKIQINCMRLPTSAYPDLESFQRAYFQAEHGILEYELI